MFLVPVDVTKGENVLHIFFFDLIYDNVTLQIGETVVRELQGGVRQLHNCRILNLMLRLQTVVHGCNLATLAIRGSCHV